MSNVCFKVVTDALQSCHDCYSRNRYLGTPAITDGRTMGRNVERGTFGGPEGMTPPKIKDSENLCLEVTTAALQASRD